MEMVYLTNTRVQMMHVHLSLKILQMAVEYLYYPLALRVKQVKPAANNILMFSKFTLQLQQLFK